jgi:hypothetical protein
VDVRVFSIDGEYMSHDSTPNDYDTEDGDIINAHSELAGMIGVFVRPAPLTSGMAVAAAVDPWSLWNGEGGARRPLASASASVTGTSTSAHTGTGTGTGSTTGCLRGDDLAEPGQHDADALLPRLQQPRVCRAAEELAKRGLCYTNPRHPPSPSPTATRNTRQADVEWSWRGQLVSG